MPNATMARALLVSVEAGSYASAIVAAGWTAMLWGYAGDRSGVYNRCVAWAMQLSDCVC